MFGFRRIASLCTVLLMASVIGRAQHASKSTEVTVFFRVNSTVIDLGYFGNAEALQKLDKTIDIFRMNIDSVSIVAYASPEGNFQYNQWLSANRAAAMRKLLVEKYSDVDFKSIKEIVGGPDFDGLTRKIEADPNVPYREEVLEIVRNWGNEPVATFKALRALRGGKPYSYISYKYLPWLRTATTVIFHYNASVSLYKEPDAKQQGEAGSDYVLPAKSSSVDQTTATAADPLAGLPASSVSSAENQPAGSGASGNVGGTYQIRFAVNSSVINTKSVHNAQAISAIREALGGAAPAEVIIVSHASPEGPANGNKMLSDRRAEAAMDMFGDLIPSSTKVTYRSEGEAWEGLQGSIESNYNRSDRQQVLDILSSNLSNEQKKQAINKLAPESRKHIVGELSEGLRSVTVTIVPATAGAAGAAGATDGTGAGAGAGVGAGDGTGTGAAGAGVAGAGAGAAGAAAAGAAAATSQSDATVAAGAAAATSQSDATGAAGAGAAGATSQSDATSGAAGAAGAGAAAAGAAAATSQSDATGAAGATSQSDATGAAGAAAGATSQSDATGAAGAAGAASQTDATSGAAGAAAGASSQTDATSGAAGAGAAGAASDSQDATAATAATPSPSQSAVAPVASTSAADSLSAVPVAAAAASSAVAAATTTQPSSESQAAPVADSQSGAAASDSKTSASKDDSQSGATASDSNTGASKDDSKSGAAASDSKESTESSESQSSQSAVSTYKAPADTSAAAAPVLPIVPVAEPEDAVLSEDVKVEDDDTVASAAGKDKLSVDNRAPKVDTLARAPEAPVLADDINVEDDNAVADSTATETLHVDNDYLVDTLARATADSTEYIRKPFIAVKTNLLYDLLITPNIGYEIPIGQKFSFFSDYTFPWWVNRSNDRAWQMLKWDIGGRWYFSKHDKEDLLDVLRGHHLGLDLTAGYYDLEPKHKGWQGEFQGAGIEYGYTWRLSERWRLDASIGAGLFATKFRYYKGDSSDVHLIYQNHGKLFYFGPIELGVTLKYLFTRKVKKEEEK